MTDMNARCPHADCGFEGTQDEVDDHVLYMIRIGSSDHEETR